VHPFSLAGGCAEAQALHLAERRAAPLRRAIQEPRAVCLDPWPCGEAGGLADNLPAS